jgi:hypothetical protein
MKTKRKNFVGLTLIETILYLGIAVIVLGMLFSYGWNIIGLSIKAQVIRSASQTGQLVEERLTYEIRRADSVDKDNSDFGSSPKLVLLTSSGDPVTIEDSGNQITIKRGAGDPISLNSAQVQIKNFTLTKQANDTGEVQYVGFAFDVVANYPGSAQRSEYQYSSSFSSGSALRK